MLALHQIRDVAKHYIYDNTSISEADFSDNVEINKLGFATNLAPFQNNSPPWGDWDKGHLTFCRSSIYEDTLDVQHRFLANSVYAEVIVNVSKESR